MTESPIKTIQEGHVLEVILDRPKANAIDLKTSRIMGTMKMNRTIFIYLINVISI